MPVAEEGPLRPRLWATGSAGSMMWGGGRSPASGQPGVHHGCQRHHRHCGMEGALASVVGGLADCPVIVVPTSVGYGASFQGLSALLSMLNSCASGFLCEH